MSYIIDTDGRIHLQSEKWFLLPSLWIGQVGCHAEQPC